jgi:hypothetical protein
VTQEVDTHTGLRVSLILTGPKLDRRACPAWVGSRSFYKDKDLRMGWWFGLAPATLEFWVRFPNERNQGKCHR